jgi:hypothetical protein
MGMQPRKGDLEIEIYLTQEGSTVLHVAILWCLPSPSSQTPPLALAVPRYSLPQLSHHTRQITAHETDTEGA